MIRRFLTLTFLCTWTLACLAQTPERCERCQGLIPPPETGAPAGSGPRLMVRGRHDPPTCRCKPELDRVPVPGTLRQQDRVPQPARVVPELLRALVRPRPGAPALAEVPDDPARPGGNPARAPAAAPPPDRRTVVVLPEGIPEDFAFVDEGIPDDIGLEALDPGRLPELTPQEKLQLQPGHLEYIYGRSPVLTIRLHAIRTSNDYQTDEAIITPGQIEHLVHRCNLIYAKAGVRFLFDPATDFEHRNSTLLNQDCSLAWFGQHVGDPNWDPATADTAPNHAERTLVANQYPDKLVVYFRWGTKFVWSDQYSCWQVKHATGGFSGANHAYVAMPFCMPEQNLLAHEIGHYLHLNHPFRSKAPILSGEEVPIDTVQRAAEAIRYWVEVQGHPAAGALQVFDGDSSAVYPGLPYAVDDTPPDVAGAIFVSQYGEHMNCGPYSSIWIYVTFGNGYQACYQLEPDRLNIMSYFKHCHGLGLHHFSEQQIDHMRAALLSGNRQQQLVN